MKNRNKPLKLPKNLDCLPRMGFTRRPARRYLDEKRADMAYNIKTTTQLVQAFDLRESRLRLIAEDRNQNKMQSSAILTIIGLVSVVIAAVWIASLIT